MTDPTPWFERGPTLVAGDELWFCSPIVGYSGSHTFAMTDMGHTAASLDGSPQTFTIPAPTGVVFPAGAVLPFVQHGAGTLTIAGASGVTLLAAGGLVATRSQYSVGCVQLYAADATTSEWIVFGDLA